mmetsp:Transcript_31119/g.74247  ORF Transcript_31119/g.74247 Transcript_31119/m.74247 type:complete len:242 (+) Transcript_31119:368-1093(+)
MQGALVDVLLHGLLGLHLEPPSHGVKGVGGSCSNGDGCLCSSERGDCTHHTRILLVRVQARDGVKGAQLQATVADDARDRHTKASVQGKEPTWSLGSLDQAITQATESSLARAHVRSQSCSSIVQGVHNGHAGCCCEATRHQVGAEELPKLGLGIVFGEHLLECVLEGQVERLGGEVAKAVGEVAVPETLHALLLQDTLGAVNHSGVTRHLATADLGVRVLSLHDQLHALDGSGQSLGNST